MTPQEAKEKFGATHYTTMKDGVTPQMFYKKGANGRWAYLSFCNLWQGSTSQDKEKDFEQKLKSIENE